MKKLFTLLCLCVLSANTSHAQGASFTKIVSSAVSLYSLGIKSDGTLWGWGYNSSYEAGPNLAGNNWVTQIGTATNWANIAAGSVSSLGIKSDSTLWTWGNGTKAINQIGTATNWVSIATIYQNFGITADGKLWTWPQGSFTPTQVGTATNWVSICCSEQNLGITADGKLWGWGVNDNGQVGDGTTNTVYNPTQIATTVTNWVAVAAGESHSLGITADGKLWAWGANGNGQLGNNSTAELHIPTQVGTATNWVSISAGQANSMGITADGRRWAWGENDAGQSGDGTTVEQHVPTQIANITNWTTWASVVAGSLHCLGINTDGKAMEWGYNADNELSDGTTTNRLAPVEILSGNAGLATTGSATTMQQGQYNSYINGYATIASVSNTRASIAPIMGQLTAKVWVETSQPATYVSRHYQITPANAASHTVCATAAENTNLTLTAPAGYVITDINFASYGTPTGNCTSGFTTGTCNAANSVSVISGLTLGKNSVTIPATFATFGVDPCNGTLKSLAVQATYGQTGRVTLYFLQSEFDAFNAVNPTKLPTGSSDGTGISNLLIEKRPGISSDGSGLPGTYYGTPITINPADGDIVWNSAVNRWEVSFDVTGFSGFFVKTQSAVLPLKLIGFTGSKINGANVLTWNTANEVNTKQFIVEWSMDAASWNTLGTTAAKGDLSDNYTYDHTNVPSGKIFYRLQMVDQDGQFTYSNIIWLNGSNNTGVVIYPNPVKDALNINLGNTLLNTTALLTNMEGALLQRIVITANQQQINVQALPSGMYLLTFADGTMEKFVKE